MVDVEFTRITMKFTGPKCLGEGRYKVQGEQEGAGKQREGGSRAEQGGKVERQRGGGRGGKQEKCRCPEVGERGRR